MGEREITIWQWFLVRWEFCSKLQARDWNNKLKRDGILRRTVELRLNKWARVHKIIKKLFIKLPQIPAISLILRPAPPEQASRDGYFVHKCELKVCVKVRPWSTRWGIHLLQPRLDLVWELVLIFHCFCWCYNIWISIIRLFIYIIMRTNIGNQSRISKSTTTINK